MGDRLRFELIKVFFQFILIVIAGTGFTFLLDRCSVKQNSNKQLFEDQLAILEDAHTYLRSGHASMLELNRALSNQRLGLKPNRIYSKEDQIRYANDVEQREQEYREFTRRWYADGPSIESRIKVYLGKNSRYYFHDIFKRFSKTKRELDIALKGQNKSIIRINGQDIADYLLETERRIDKYTDALEEVILKEHKKDIDKFILPNHPPISSS